MPGGPVGAPAEAVGDDDAAGHERRRISLIEHGDVRTEGALEPLPEDLLAPCDLALYRAGVGIEQQLRGIVAVALFGLPRAVRAQAVALSGPDPLDVAVPMAVDLLGQRDSAFGGAV